MNGITHIIIDEYSMLGCKMMFWIDSRLKQASGKKDVPFGGYSVIMVGDPGQLPPVGDSPLYKPLKSHSSNAG